MESGSRVLAAVVALSLTAGCATTPKVQVTGREVTVIPDGDGNEMKGELVAVGPRRLWVQDEEGLTEVHLPSVREVRVRHGSGPSALTWALTGGLITGAVLAGACASVEGTQNCGLIGAAVAGAWLLVGALATPSVDSARRVDLPHPTPEELRPFARFPQGWPAGLMPAGGERAESPPPEP